MKSRHAAALALVGWYLMVPPLCSSHWTNGNQTACSASAFNYDVPLDRWRESASFNSLHKCEISAAEKGPYTHCKCVSTDDPRLKGK